MDTRDIAVSHIVDAGTLAPAARQSLLAHFDSITNRIWRKPADVFQRLEPWVFAPAAGLLLGHSHGGELVAFSVYRRIVLDSVLIVHRETTNVIPAVQGRGVWTAFTHRLRLDLAPNGGRLHLALRTRNPIIYMANYRVCEAMVPDLFRQGPSDPSLEDLAHRAAERLYPHLDLHRPSMVMPGAYVGTSYREAPRHRDEEINTRFFGAPGLAQPTSALFVLGRLKP